VRQLFILIKWPFKVSYFGVSKGDRWTACYHIISLALSVKVLKDSDRLHWKWKSPFSTTPHVVHLNGTPEEYPQKLVPVPWATEKRTDKAFTAK